MLGKKKFSKYLREFQFELGRCQPVKASPEQTVERHNHRADQDRGPEQHREISCIRRAADDGAETGDCECLSSEMKVFGNDARVPGTTRSCHEARNQIRKNSR